MLNYFNFRKFDDRVLITNDFGNYAFLSPEEIENLIHDKIDYHSDLGLELQEKLFISDKTREEFLQEIKWDLRSAKSHLLHCTALHIFVITNACNLKCVYCQARSGNETHYNTMSFETAEKAVDFALQCPDREITFEFQGGEPLVGFKTIRHIVEYAESHKKDKKIIYSLVSNLLLMTDEILDFIKKYNVGVSTSLDGDEITHNYNRPFIDGNPTYQCVCNKIRYLKKEGIEVGAIQTTTKISLRRPKEIIKAYLNLGINSLFIRPLTPLGYAYNNWDRIGYSAEEFIHFYKECLDDIIKLNREGTFFREGHAAIFLHKILYGEDPDYMELRSPCGGAVGQLAYFFNGDIYTCDEGRMLGEMGNNSFRLGSVYADSYDKVICSGTCKAVMAASFLESIPECCDCVYQPFCGTCPVVNLALNGDIFPSRPNDYKCVIYKGMLDILFSYLEHADDEMMNIFQSWVEWG